MQERVRGWQSCEEQGRLPRCFEAQKGAVASAQLQIPVRPGRVRAKQEAQGSWLAGQSLCGSGTPAHPWYRRENRTGLQRRAAQLCWPRRCANLQAGLAFSVSQVLLMRKSSRRCMSE